MSSNPVAWMHTIHMEDGQTAVRLARAEIDRPWGKPGVDFDQSYSVTIEPLYTRPSPDRLAVAYIQREVLDILAKDKTATGTVCSGMIQKPFGNPVPLYTNPAPSGQAVAPTVNELFANCDRWGAVEWFNRLAMAIHNRDKAVVAGDDLSFATYDNIAKSSASRFVHDFEQEVRSALSQPHPADERVVEALIKRTIAARDYFKTTSHHTTTKLLNDILENVLFAAPRKGGRNNG